MDDRNPVPESNIIANAFVAALRDRPADFSFDCGRRYTLIDARTGHEWWVANEDYGFHLREPTEIRFGFWARRKMWRAFLAWERDCGDGEPARQVFLQLDDANLAARAA